MNPRALIRPTAAAALTLALLGAARAPLWAQQPAGGAQNPGGAAAAPKDPRAAILERLHKLDAKPDTARRDSAAAAADSVQTLAAPTAGGARRTPMAAVQIEQDSIMKALEELPGYTPTLYAGKSARFAADTGRLVLLADSAHKAKVVQGDQAMTADSSLVYNQNSQIACGYGKPLLSGAGQSDPVESDQVCYDTQKRMGVAYGARTKFQQGATAWYVNGHQVYLTGSGDQEKLYGAESEFTDCNLAEPHYHFTAKEVKIVRNDLLVARNVTLSFADVPVFWLPFMMQPMQQGRHSGLLMPRFDLNDIARTNANYQRRVQNLGFYWAINDHLDALTSIDWFSGNYTALNSGFTYAFRRQFLDGGLAFARYWRTGGSKELTLRANNSWRPDERTNINANVSYASSSSFVLSQSFDPRELNRSIDSNVGISRRFGFGSLDFSASRRQLLSTNRVTTTLPTVNLSLVPVSLFRRSDGSALLTWNGSGSYSGSAQGCGLLATSACDPASYALSAAPGTQNKTASFTSSLQFGKFSWGQSFNFQGASTLERPAFALKDASGRDSGTVAALPGAGKNTLAWSTSLSFQQRLIGTSSISPSLSITGQSASVDSTAACTPDRVRCTEVHTNMVAAPMRLNFGVGTQVDLYGFWPGVGPFAKIRHKLSPSFSYSYSPAPAPVQRGSLQDIIFGGALLPGQVSPLRETNMLNIGLNQTFEAKYKEKAKPDSAKDAAPADTGSLDGEPRRLPETRKMLLLAIQTSAVAYDFTSDPRTGRRIGFQAPQISNSIRSDLLPGLQFNITHDIFTYSGPDSLGTSRPRHFAPFLTNASTSFTLNDQSWLFRVLGLASRGGKTKRDSAVTAQPDTTRRSLTDQMSSGTGLGLVPGGRGDQSSMAARGNVGSWNASFTYNLSRQRPSGLPSNIYGCNPIFGPCNTSTTSQMVQGNFTFQPTPNWSVTWQTAYNFSEHQFADHVLTLTRDLHDWQANFDFVKAQNGNFTFQFRVALKAQPDLKFDYRQNGGNYNNPGGF